MYDSILVPTDGSEHALAATAHARLLATTFDATVHVLAATDIERAAGPFNAGGVDDAFLDRLEERAEADIDAVTEAVSADGAVETAIERGDPREVILDYAAAHDVDVIAMGTHGRSGLSRYVLGSVTEHVVRHAEVPVLTVRATERARSPDTYDEIMVPTDGSVQAEVAIDHAVALASQTGARVHAVNVVDVTALSTGPDFTMPTALLDELRSGGQEATAAIAQRARDEGLDAVTAVEEGFPARTLLEYSADNGIDVIAMGTHGRTGLDRFLVGSTTERVVRRADVPVLAVRGEGAPQ